MYHCVLQMALHKCGGTVPLTIPLLKVSLSQLTTSSTRSTCAHANTHVRALKHTQTSQLMGLNLINCSETDTLSLINPFLRLRAHRGALTIQRANAHSHTNTYIWEGGGGLDTFTHWSPREKNMVICQDDSTLKHPNYIDKATLFWCWMKCEWFCILLLCLWNINQPQGSLSALLNICKLFYFGLVCFQWLLWIVFG